MHSGGRRERRKAELRARISDAATALFLQRGFDEVSVSEIAEAADVARPTVFAHFARKEDLLFDRHPEAAELLIRAIRERSGDITPVRALGDALLGLAAQGHPLAVISADFAPFWRLVAGSRALQARARELAEKIEAELARVLGETGAADPELTAAFLVAAYRSVHLTAIRRVLAGDAVPDVAAEHTARVRAAFDTVDCLTSRLPRTEPDRPCS
ncbi:MAG TPA: helix-turn-helix domain-containing protein [Pseudonocardiaceae bacterium]|nr:helix-turn-helix domain-containing protein [Pseudonocardiaceae bacterium]